MRSASFGSFLPYWTTLQVAVRPSGSLSTPQVVVIVLKDGTLAVGLRVRGLETYGVSKAQINAHTQALREGLCALPPDGYLQAIFESGLSCDAVFERFGQQSAAAPYPLLQRGRHARRIALQQKPDLTRCQITYWVGWKKALAALVPGPKRWIGSRRPTLGADGAAKVRLAAQQLVDVAVRVMDTLATEGLSMRFLQEAEMLADCHRAINPTAPKAFKPQSSWDQRTICATTKLARRCCCAVPASPYSSLWGRCAATTPSCCLVVRRACFGHWG